MSDEHVSQEPARDAAGAIAQKPKYEAPAIVDLDSSSRHGAGKFTGCGNGSGNSECGSGSAASFDCFDGAGVH